ncbi:MAG: phenylacetic acid degradation protein PaaN [Betaproteobacteria bacterium]|nr:phenylacetic acid degradation protein PaaN [Betaproteobacteria bacterium]
MSHPMFEKHQALLTQALNVIEERGYWSPYAENSKAYGEHALEEGRAAFEAYRDAQFYLDQPGMVKRGGAEVSPYGLPLNISYPMCQPDALIAAAGNAMPPWIKAGPDIRAGVCIEMLARLNSHSMEMAHAVMHTTGQGLLTAFQIAGPQAQGRGLEAVACAWREMRQVPEKSRWEKPRGNRPPLRVDNVYTIAPRGVALVVGCATSPTWNSYPGIFASLATGNPVIVKPHPSVILPLALSVAVARQTLKDAGFDPNLVCLLVDEPDALIAKEVAAKAAIRIIDYTGGPLFGEWLEEHARQAKVFAAKAAVNCAVIDSTSNYQDMLNNLVITLSLYSGQMCATPQAIFVSREGVQTPAGNITLEQFQLDLAQAFNVFLDNTARALEILGAIQSPAAVARIAASRELGEVLCESTALRHPLYPDARIHTPLLLKVGVADSGAYAEERFGPISFVVEAATTQECLSAAERVMREKGALSFSVHTTSAAIRQMAEDVSLRAGVSLSLNLTDGVYVNQPAGFADYHATGANAAANASLIDSAFVASRFFVLQSRRPA